MKLTDEMLRQETKKATEIWSSSLPDENDHSHVFSQKFERKARRLLRRQRNKGASRMLRRVAMAFICIGVSVSAVLMTSEAARMKLYNVISYTLSDGTAVVEYDNTENLRLEDFHIVEPAYIPAGLEESHREEYSGSLFVVYGDWENPAPDKPYVEYSQEFIKGMVLAYDVDGTDVETVKVGNDRNAQLVSEDGYIMLFWTDRNSQCCVASNMGKRTVLKVARSVPSQDE